MSPVILLVEDNPLNARLVQTIVRVRSWPLVHVVDAAAALDWLATRTPALILLDIQLPGRDGISLCQQLRAEPRWRSLPIVAVTAHAMAGDEQRLLAAGFDAYLSKPFRYAELYRLLSPYMDGERQPEPDPQC